MDIPPIIIAVFSDTYSSLPFSLSLGSLVRFIELHRTTPFCKVQPMRQVTRSIECMGGPPSFDVKPAPLPLQYTGFNYLELSSGSPMVGV